MKSWVIVVDDRRAGGMLHCARKLGGEVVAVVVGPQSLVEKTTQLGFDRVLCFKLGNGAPAEVYAFQIAEKAKAENPTLVMSTDTPAGRLFLGAIAAALDAPLISNVQSISMDGEAMVVSRSIAEGSLLKDIEVQQNVAVIFDGEDFEQTTKEKSPIEYIQLENPIIPIDLVEEKWQESSVGLLTADRVIAVGLGIKTKEDLKMIDQLAETVNGEIGCTLPLCDDMRWFSSDRVIGSSHMKIAPDLYIGIGISGDPHHTSGIRDAKKIVAINDDPNARIFKHCHYGIVGDLYKVVPALISVLNDRSHH